MTATWLPKAASLALITFGVIRLMGGVADSPLSRLIPGWPGLAAGAVAVAGGLWIYLRFCPT